MQKSQLYHAIHSAGMLTIDTRNISWKQLETEQSLDRELTKEDQKNRSK
jgi:hypothetical protein